MATSLLLEGDDLEALLDRARQEGGPHARIVRAEKVRQGGVMGFFAKERFEVAVEIPDDAPHEEIPIPTRRALRAGTSWAARNRDDDVDTFEDLREHPDAQQYGFGPAGAPSVPGFGGGAPADALLDRIADPVAGFETTFDQSSARVAAAQRAWDDVVASSAWAQEPMPAYAAVQQPSAAPAVQQAAAQQPAAPAAAFVPAQPPQMRVVGQPDEAYLEARTPDQGPVPVAGRPGEQGQQGQHASGGQHGQHRALRDDVVLSDGDELARLLSGELSPGALAAEGLLGIVDRVSAAERAASRAVAGQPLSAPQSPAFSIPMQRGGRAEGEAEAPRVHVPVEVEVNQAAQSAAYAAMYAAMHGGEHASVLTAPATTASGFAPTLASVTGWQASQYPAVRPDVWASTDLAQVAAGVTPTAQASGQQHNVPTSALMVTRYSTAGSQNGTVPAETPPSVLTSQTSATTPAGQEPTVRPSTARPEFTALLEQLRSGTRPHRPAQAMVLPAEAVQPVATPAAAGFSATIPAPAAPTHDALTPAPQPLSAPRTLSAQQTPAPHEMQGPHAGFGTPSDSEPVVDQDRRTAQDAAEAAAAQAARFVAERLEAERAEAERQEALRQEAARLEAERAEAARLLSQERAEAARRLEAELAEAARQDALRQEAERAEAARQEFERRESERIAAERAEAERLEEEWASAGTIEAQAAAAVRAEAERAAVEAAEQKRLVEEHRAALESARVQAEAERIAAHEIERHRRETMRLTAELAEAERFAVERAHAERAAAERAAVERAEATRLAAELAQAQRMAAERAAAERANAAQAEIERANAQRLAEELAEAERVATERIAAERAAFERSESARLAAERAEAAARRGIAMRGRVTGMPIPEPRTERVERLDDDLLDDDPFADEPAPLRGLQVAADRSTLRDLGVPASWTRRMREGDRFAAVLKVIEPMPDVEIDPETAVIAVVGPAHVVQLEAFRTALELPLGPRPRPVVVVPAAVGPQRAAAIARAQRHDAVVVAIEAAEYEDVETVRESLDILAAGAVIAVVDAHRTVEQTQAWLDALGSVDALAVDSAAVVRQPAAVLQLGLPVIRLDGIPVDRVTWTALLCAQLEAANPADPRG